MFDYFLYVALGAGFLAGRLVRWRSPWVDRATLADVAALVFFLGLTISNIPGARLAATIPLVLGFAVLILGITLGIALALPRRPPQPGTGKPPRPIGLVFLVALVVGYGVGRVVALPATDLLTASLYLLLALVGFNLRLSWQALRSTPAVLGATVGGALVAAPLFALATGISLRVSLATSLGFGWYSLAGPLVTTTVGPIAGLVAFLTNFLRENLTMVTAPWIGRRVRAEGLTAMGGATAMDSTLYFVTAYGDADAGSLALASGLVLTVLAGVLLPLLLAAGA